jgi:N-acetylmuramoyl-L-alanine amidase
MAIKICLDAGHYGKYNQSPAVKSYYESEMTWKLTNLLKAELIAYGFEVTLTRSNQARDLAVYDRGKLSKGCNLFLSIHSNAVGSAVNDNTDYPAVAVQLDGKGDKLGKLLADIIHKTMGTKQPGKIFTRRGNSGEYYGVLRGAAAVGTMGLILEHSFHTNTAAAKWLSSDANLKKMAVAEAQVIADYYGVKKPTTAGKLYRVQVGAYSVKANADAMLNKLKAAGFDGYITSN